MANIETLIKDIHSLLKKENHIPNPDNLRMFHEHVEFELRKSLEEGKSREPELRMSLIGRPDRQLWFQFNMPELWPSISAENRMRFLIGHHLEAYALFLAREAGHTVECHQEEIEIAGVKGHLDAVIDGEVVDVKTCSPWAYGKFAEATLRQNDSFGYIPQISGYAKAKGKNKAFFWAINKSTAEMALFQLDERGMIDPEARINHLKSVIASPLPPPNKCYLPVPDNMSESNMVVHRECEYCPALETCWQDANDGQGLRKFKYAQKIKYFTQVKKKPRVPEIT
jgi:hypothetical protein